MAARSFEVKIAPLKGAKMTVGTEVELRGA